MPSMITVCPGCGRKGIMSKATGECFHCGKGSAAPKVTIVAVPPAVVTPVRSSAPAPVKRPMPRLHGGRVIR